MPSAAQYIEIINKELAGARAAAGEGNDGKTRVCARRAAGTAIEWYVTEYHGAVKGTDALSRLKYFAEDPTFPAEVREAAQKLLTRVTDRFQYPFSTDPIADASLITDYFIRIMDEGAPR
jgi:hypothetical protein